MQQQLSKGKTILFVIALFLTNVNIMQDMAIIPAAANLFEHFGESVGLVNFILSGPQIIGVISALICAKLMQYFSKKTLLVVGFAFFTVASLLGIAVENAVYIAAMRAIDGAAMGIVNVAGVALLAEVFVDEKQRSLQLGWYNSAMAIIGAAMSFAAGLLATTAWQAVFKVYWVTLPILVLLIFFLPKTPPEQATMKDRAAIKEPMPLGRFIPFCLSILLFVLNYMLILYLIALYVVEKSLGSEAITGLLGSFSTIGSAVFCALFGLTFSKLKRGTIIPSYIIIFLGYLLLYSVTNLTLTFVAITLMGAAFGNGFSYFYMRVTQIVPQSKVSFAIGVVTAIQGFSMFLSTYYFSILQNILKVDTFVGVMPVLFTTMGIGAVLSIILTIRNKKNPAEYGAKVLEL